MTEHRRAGLSDEELEVIADKIVEKTTNAKLCSIFTTTEQNEIKNIITTKRHAVKGILWVVGILVLWVLKDIYFWVSNHISWGK